jgi:predicted thioesterase
VAPSGVGETVTAEATLDKIDGRRLMFTVSVSDSHGLVAAGKVTRVLVDRERFLERVS